MKPGYIPVHPPEQRPLSVFEKMIQHYLVQGLTVREIAAKLRMRTEEIEETRYSILKKGWDLSMARVKFFTEEEKQEIAAFVQDHTLKETAEHFGRSVSGIRHMLGNLDSTPRAKEETAEPVPAAPTYIHAPDCVVAVAMDLADALEKEIREKQEQLQQVREWIHAESAEEVRI